ncbi:MAG TPA: hypothetical protein VGO40_12125 [Longimicrobium sp.]|jgi:hypothetical protein|nr:hypothetical protein [Longimicrobium sp.]
MAEDQQRRVSTVPLLRGAATHLAEAAASPYLVAGEPFYVEIEDGFYFIRHAQWSLVGMGKTLPEAERDLLSEASELREVLASPSPVPMDPELSRLAAFLHRL